MEMSPSLLGIHDREGASFSPAGTWVLDTIALSENPTPPSYDSNHAWIVRANWGYGATGTIPLDAGDQAVYITRLVSYAKRIQNVGRIVIGNEPNLPREWPSQQPIFPQQYADFYRRCRAAVHQELGEKIKILIAAPGPWNDQLKYAGNEKGDWIQNFSDVIRLCGDSPIDGFSIHSYTHGYNVGLVTAQTFMNSPFAHRHYDFQTYHDYLNAIPDQYADLEIHLTEANGGKSWQPVGLMWAMAAEINAYNQNATARKIKSLIFYRYPPYDNFSFQDNQAVKQEYLQTVQKNFQSPSVVNLPVIITPPQANAPTPQPPVLPEKLIEGKPLALVQATILNVRDRPGTQNSKIIGTKKTGDKISILDEKEVNGDWWYQIGPDQWVISEWTNRPHADQLSDWQRARNFTAGWEGGFQDFEWDAGNWTECRVGAGTKKGTNFGITACSYPNRDIEHLTRQEADDIYYSDYWLKCGCDKLPWPLNLVVFDTAINFGTTIASYYLKQSGGDILLYIGLRLKGYRHSDAWPQAGNAWIDRMIDLIGEAKS